MVSMFFHKVMGWAIDRCNHQANFDESPKQQFRVDTCLGFYRTCSSNMDLYNTFLHPHL